MSKPIEELQGDPETAKCPYCIKNDMRLLWRCVHDGHSRWLGDFCNLEDLKKCVYQNLFYWEVNKVIGGK